MKKWPIISDKFKYVQLKQHPIGNYELEFKAQEERYGIKYRMVKEMPKEISFDSYHEKLKQDYLDILKGVKSGVIYTAKMMK